MSGIVEWYKDLMYNKAHPLTKEWFLISGPGPLAMIIASYVYFCLFAGPRYMKDKKPYELRTTLIVYNFIQVLFSIYLFYEGLMSGWLHDYDYRCQPVDYSENPQTLRMAKAVHFYFMCKLIEMLDTVFFVLRKKDRQISALHVYHHAIMPFCAWVGIRFVPNGHGTFLGVINAFIHIIMYAYYMLTSIGPHMNKYLWWKKYITILQLVQFVLVFVHTAQLFFNGCNFPKSLAFLLLVNALLFIYMFGSFYVENYIKQDRNKRKTDPAADKTE
ncbi:elongation of very long chain fatty acids protein-like [Frieseomelitta varia]|nr:elongation of very long chain fatty acids protein-like [Frieseomelitta varia]XP_043508604.1 elongation of very long chain fatty acids protein-like [Frieseomelitta varia]XP_043508605.1 elongation of very long chain fatty acids protein-like [Frieseomelitta varia]